MLNSAQSLTYCIYFVVICFRNTVITVLAVVGVSVAVLASLIVVSVAFVRRCKNSNKSYTKT